MQNDCALTLVLSPYFKNPLINSLFGAYFLLFFIMVKLPKNASTVLTRIK